MKKTAVQPERLDAPSGIANRKTEDERARCGSSPGTVTSARAPAHARRRNPIGLHATPGSGWHEHTQALTRSRQLLSERVATPVLLAEVLSPSQGLGGAALGRESDARRDEQRGVAVMLSPGVTEDPLCSFLRCDAHRVDGGVAVGIGQRDAGARALDQRDYRGRGSFGLCSSASSRRTPADPGPSPRVPSRAHRRLPRSTATWPATGTACVRDGRDWTSPDRETLPAPRRLR